MRASGIIVSLMELGRISTLLEAFMKELSQLGSPTATEGSLMPTVITIREM